MMNKHLTKMLKKRIRIAKANSAPETSAKKESFVQHAIKRFGVIRIIEFVAVLIGLLVVSHEYVIEKPRDRTVRFATLANQIAIARSSSDIDIRRSAAITIAALAREGFAMREINMTGLDFSNLDLSGGNFYRANLSNTNLTKANISNADFTFAKLQNTIMISTLAENSLFRYTNFIGSAILASTFNYSEFVIPFFDRATLLGNFSSGAYFEMYFKMFVVSEKRKLLLKSILKEGFCSESIHPKIEGLFSSDEKERGLIVKCYDLYRAYTPYRKNKIDTAKVKRLFNINSLQALEEAHTVGKSIKEFSTQLDKLPTTEPLPDWLPYEFLLAIKQKAHRLLPL